MASAPKSRRRTVQPHVAVDDDIRHQLFGWKATYNQRAVLVRVMCKGGKSKMDSGIQFVKFIDSEIINRCEYPDRMPEEYSEFSYMGSNVSLDNFYDLLKEYHELRDFNLSAMWEDIFTIVEQRGYYYTPGRDAGWKSKEWTRELQEKYNILSTEQKIFLTTFETALKCDMRKGEAKTWMTKMVELMKSGTDEALRVVLTLEPSLHDNTNTELEVINGDQHEDFQNLFLPYNQPLKSSSAASDLFEDSEDSEENISKIHRFTVVPDFCVLLPDYPGVFPLVTEMKSANCELQGLTRNIGQLLSKMHFQDIVFGVVITPTAYILSVIRKSDKTNELLFQRAVVDLTTVDSDGNLTLNLNNFKELCTFVYRVLKLSLLTKCQL
ncbi:uncharacterized protein LOC117318788 [Pecten maximus]|uniref:uncharacterized protein LOC117318788 n=1 Tax=Pecten maximus TaxID=6579 RepID=UPI001457EF0B|nr:uncharacterized protein LOC117318788 [Pecten maximus]